MNCTGNSISNICTSCNYHYLEKKENNIIIKCLNIEYDIIFIVDTTGSMSNYFYEINSIFLNILQELTNNVEIKYYFKYGIVFYKNPVHCNDKENKYIQLTNNFTEIINYFQSESFSGGCDIEDWIGSYYLALYNIFWRNGTRLIIHITDGTHSKEGDEETQLGSMIAECTKKNIRILGLYIEGFLGNASYSSFVKYKKVYDINNGPKFEIMNFLDINNNTQFKSSLEKIIYEVN